MLVYHPAYDAFHSLFRFLIIVGAHHEIELAKARILDFYFLFPAEIRNVKLPKEHSVVKAEAKKLINRYRGPVNSNQVFREIEHIQLAAIGALAAAEILEKDYLVTGVLRRTEKGLTEEIQSQVVAYFENLPDTIEYILNELVKFPLKGDGGLKHRTGLLEYRYDNA